MILESDWLLKRTVPLKMLSQFECESLKMLMQKRAQANIVTPASDNNLVSNLS